MEKIGIIGFGNMGSAIGERLKDKYPIYVFDKDKHKTENLSGIKVADDIINLVNQVDTVILAVKPQDFDVVLSEIKNCIKDKLVISIAAGITTEYIEKCLGKVRVIRAMPNIGIKINQSVTSLCTGAFASSDDSTFVQGLFNCLGKTWVVKEKMINPSTAISGSGPAYICQFLESQSIHDPDNIPEQEKQNFLRDFKKAAESDEVGFNIEDAEFLVNATFTSTINILKEQNISPSELKEQVASPGGTTEAALRVLGRGGSLKEAVKAALKRAQELSRR